MNLWLIEVPKLNCYAVLFIFSKKNFNLSESKMKKFKSCTLRNSVPYKLNVFIVLSCLLVQCVAGINIEHRPALECYDKFNRPQVSVFFWTICYQWLCLSHLITSFEYDFTLHLWKFSSYWIAHVSSVSFPIIPNLSKIK